MSDENRDPPAPATPEEGPDSKSGAPPPIKPPSTSESPPHLGGAADNLAGSTSPPGAELEGSLGESSFKQKVSKLKAKFQSKGRKVKQAGAKVKKSMRKVGAKVGGSKVGQSVARGYRKTRTRVSGYVKRHPRLKSATESSRRVGTLTLKELNILKKDRFALFIIFLLPVALILTIQSATDGFGPPPEEEDPTAGASLTGGTQVPQIGLIDLDDSEGILGRDLSQEFVDLCLDYAVNRSALDLYLTDNLSRLDEMLGKGDIAAYVVIPQMFEFNLSIHFIAFLSVHIDTISSLALESAQSVIDDMVTEFKQTNGYEGVFELDIIDAGVPPRGQGRGLFVISPLFFPVVLFSIAALTSAQAIVSDVPKDRMVMTPANKFELLMAKWLANQILLSLLVIIMIGMSWGFGLRPRGSLVVYFFFLFVISMAGIWWGLMLSSFAKYPLAALQLFIFMLLFMMIILLFVETESILIWIPVVAGNRLLELVTLRGESLATNNNWKYVASMSFESFVLFVVTYVRFKKTRAML